ncbi:MAG: SGNH/GDSL hydrolase family protein [Clostridiales bacterium]|nr:MAG: SGNH/GDSL hydrolase family protein [Clostridiales bacterium]
MLQKIKKIAIYGDSILKGVIYDEKTRHYSVANEAFEKLAEELPDVQISNFARFGCTIRKGYRYFTDALKKGLQCDSVVVEFGGNDADFNWAEVSAHPEEEHLPNTPLHAFEELLVEMLRELKTKGIRPILMSLPPIHAERYLDFLAAKGLSKENILRWLGDVQMIYRFQEMYSNAITKIAYMTETLLADVRAAFLDKHNFAELFCQDGIHPNEKGQILVRQTFVNLALAHPQGI